MIINVFKSFDRHFNSSNKILYGFRIVTQLIPTELIRHGRSALRDDRGPLDPPAHASGDNRHGEDHKDNVKDEGPQALADQPEMRARISGHSDEESLKGIADRPTRDDRVVGKDHEAGHDEKSAQRFPTLAAIMRQGPDGTFA